MLTSVWYLVTSNNLKEPTAVYGKGVPSTTPLLKASEVPGAGTFTPVAPKVFKIVPAILLGTLIFLPLKSAGFTTLVSFM